jgi:hypothetical protein
MTKLWGTLQLIAVEIDEAGAPVRFRWNNSEYLIECVSNKWRADRGWWERRIWREYFKVATKSGMLAVIYHDFIMDKWFLQQIYD